MFGKEKGAEVFNEKCKKIAIGNPNNDQEGKKQKHLDQKAKIQARRGPGEYPI